MSYRGTDRRGSTLAAALALAFLVTAITTISLARIACSWAQISSRHKQAKALFLAEAGVRKAGQLLTTDRSYTGESGTRLPTGTFDVTVRQAGGGYEVTSTGAADSAIKLGRKRTVQATIRLGGGESFRIENWREHP